MPGRLHAVNTNSCMPVNNSNHKEPYIIVGAGWSGLACAITLLQSGHQVCILESARQAGGRARRIQVKGPLSDHELDNGQHIMLGAYHYTLDILKILGLKESDLLKRQPLCLPLYSPKHCPIKIKAFKMPAPFHLLGALLNISSISLFDRFKAIKFTMIMALKGFNLEKDISVEQLLNKYNQPQILISALWEPLCLATLNTPIHYASAAVFLNVLKDSFNNKRQDSDLLFFKKDLSETLVHPALNYLEKHSSQLVTSCKVEKLTTKSSGNQFIVHTRQGVYKSSVVILATPAHITHKLMQTMEHQNQPRGYNFLISDNSSLLYQYEPICTIYLQYPPTITLPEPMIGLFDTIGQWAIDRSLTQQPGLIAVVISGPGKHTSMTHDQLANTIHEELKSCLKCLPDPLHYKVITEKKATFSCHVNIEHQRPSNKTSIPGLYIAGDYTSTRYPSTLEGAIKSGVTAAHLAIKLMNQST